MKLKKYITPEITIISLDNEISLQLASLNPTAPPTGYEKIIQRRNSAATDADPYNYETW